MDIASRIGGAISQNIKDKKIMDRKRKERLERKIFREYCRLTARGVPIEAAMRRMSVKYDIDRTTVYRIRVRQGAKAAEENKSEQI